MYVYHPPQSVNGLAPENTFLVADSANMTIADGFLIPTYHPYLFPERPINLYISIRSKGPGKDMLLGALLGRAQQLRKQNPTMTARVFAQVTPQNTAMMAFYMESGFDAIDALDVVQLGVPNARPAAPMGYDMGFVPLSTPTDVQNFLLRMNAYRLDAWQPELLQRYMSLPHFFAMYLSRGRDVVGEIAFTGEGQAAKLIGLYVAPNYRRLGMAKCLIAAGMKTLSEHGVNHVESDVIRRNEAQCLLSRSCSATFIRTACYYPGLNYD
ncbi:MAG: GNAT family N-acetyltransferase [Eubacteriales bacterium]|nr:GNAT family N-acetyltransferase [Eubacteriales bacterium]